ncbi:MAG: hypothetical protein ACYTG1_04230 [Planctomycetota bacterium]|jgi:hypothetical protein
MHLATRCLLGATALVGLTAPVAASTYRITMDRPAEVGRQTRVVAHGSDEHAVIAVRDGREVALGETRSSITFDATAIVMAVDRDGHPSRVRYRIQQCEMEQDGETSVFGAAGSELTAERRGDRTVFALDGRPVEAGSQPMLELVAGLADPEMSDDRIFGTEGTRSIGDQWPVHAETAAGSLSRQIGQPVEPSGISGTTSFVDVKEHHGHEVLVLRSRLTVDDVAPPAEALPPGAEVRSATMSATFQRLFPQHASLPTLGGSMRVKLEATLVAPGGPDDEPVELQLRGKRVVQRDVTPIDESNGAVATVPSDAR